jgi:Protein of unknown function (DUF2510)
MADVEAGQGAGAGVVATWRTPLETTALILLAALVVSIVGAIVGAVFRPGAEAWVKLSVLGINVVSPWHVAVLVIAVGLVFALRMPFPPDVRGAPTARLLLLGAAVLSAVVALCALIGIIGTIGLDIFGVTIPRKIGQIMELLGGGAVAVAVGLLALRGQSLVPAPVRTPAPPTVPTTAEPGAPGWAADPYGRHQWRYWDGNRWTEQVADGSTQSTDPAQ